MVSEPKKQAIVRRNPQLARGEHRVALLLDAAATVIEEVGYDAATMTAIAKTAHSSIGAVYQYYRDKAAIAGALCEKLGDDLSRELKVFQGEASSLDLHEMILQLVDLLSVFATKHKSLMLLIHLPIAKGKEPAFRRKLRLLLSQLLQAKAKHLSDEEAYRIASVVMQVLKSLSPLRAEIGPSATRGINDEFRVLMVSYLEARLGTAVE